VKSLHAKIGELILENDCRERLFRRGAHQSGIADRKTMIDRVHDLPVTRQAKALNLARIS